MKFTIDPKIFEEFQNLKVGVITAKNIDNNRRISAVESLLRGVSMQRKREFEKKTLDEDPRILRWREAYARFGAKPSKYPSSIEALLARIIEDKEIPHINSLVDIYNYMSLKSVIPVGGEDMDKFYGDVKLTYAFGGECFRPINTVEIKQVRTGEIIYKDRGGVIVRRWNYREAERTKITKDTHNALIVLEDLNDIQIEEFEKILYEFQDLIERYLGGDVAVYILTEDNNEIDLEIEGLKKADDSRLSEKEKIHFIAQQELGKQRASARTPAQKNETLAKAKPLGKAQTKAQAQAGAVPSFDSPDSYKEKLALLLKEIVSRKFPDEAEKIKVEYPSDETHGDYATNIAMRIGSRVQANPRDVANELVKAIEKPDYIEKMEVAGPGFINFYLSEDALEQNIGRVLKEGDDYGESNVGRKKTVIVEYSQPNIAKPLGVHHLLSTIIGQSLYEIYKNRGFTTISINHIGDWGTQFGKLIHAYKTWGDKEAVEKDPIPELLKLYVRFHDEAERDENLDQKGRDEFKKLEDGDEENRALWKWVVDVSMKDVQKTYDKLGNITFDFTLGESFYEDKMKPVVEEGIEKGVITEGEKGALIVDFHDENMAPLVIQKSDGATLYSTRDLATFKYRIEKWDPIKIIYVVDVAQSLYFKQLFETAKRLGWDYGKGEHIVFGRMQLPEGGMSTRKGNVILLNEVLDEAVKRAKEVLEEKAPDLADKDEAARKIGIGAVKYNVLSQNRNSDITFEWDKMLSLEGNSSPYLQYTYARARSIVRKAETLKKAGLVAAAEAEAEGKADTKVSPKRKRKAPQIKKEQFSLFEAIEHLDNGGDLSRDILPDPENAEKKEESLLRSLVKFSEYIAITAEENKPNLLATYLYELAQKFNSFYNSVPVIKADKEEKFDHRLALVKAASQVLKNGLSLLQVEVLEEM
ncbi:MAG: arginine--tRNA ligase [Candidatus Gracilibacteria bacterium]